MTAGAVVWFTGRPAAGKSTLAISAATKLRERGLALALLDGDEVRSLLVPRPGYDEPERDAFYATLAGLAALLANQGLVVLVAATAHRKSYRDRARRLAPRFVEVHVDVPLQECQGR
ncbi:MAG TPA: adenylyl-sulfate kinase, partial [Polyangiaceae bacterium]|nr:adenylyl-sulfate kinase [Polyangiaceae bacterium]